VPRLIVNADDFGLTSGVNRAILELHQAGVLTSATLMARATATEEAIEIAKATPSLGVGCHVVLVDGEPVLSGIHDIPNVADPAYGRFESTLGSFLNVIYRGKKGNRAAWRWKDKVDYQIEIEARAQIQSLQSRGVRLTHIDTHKHTHMFPRVLRPVLRAARSCGIRAVRNPFEPAWSVAATPGAPITRKMQVRLLHALESTFRRIVLEEGLITTEGALGVLATGTLDPETVTSLLRPLPASGTYELVTHPGYNDADLAQSNTRLLASRETEQQALLLLREPTRTSGLIPDLISFADL
jgi:chitin disaccharide deacetylase